MADLAGDKVARAVRLKRFISHNEAGPPGAREAATNRTTYRLRPGNDPEKTNRAIRIFEGIVF